MDGRDDATKAVLALNAVEELSYKKKNAVIEQVGDPAELYSQRHVAFVRNVLGESGYSEFKEKLASADKLASDAVKRGIHIITYLDEEYPQALRNVDGFPFILYAYGDASLLKKDAIAVVGTRRPTRYGAKVADSFAREFARAGLVVISGFARGIDGIAHKACMEAGSPTIAVFACGLDICYPAEHKGLKDAIISNGGLIVSEYPLGTKPLQYHFPERNRIISGLSRAVFLPEAAKKSGSLITVRFAIEQGRDVFAVPCNIYSEEGEGSNELLREMPHALCISPEDVLDALRVKRAPSIERTVELTLSQNAVTEALKDNELHFEQLLEITGLTVNELTDTMINLELNGIVEQTGGNYYVLS